MHVIVLQVAQPRYFNTLQWRRRVLKRLKLPAIRKLDQQIIHANTKKTSNFYILAVCMGIPPMKVYSSHDVIMAIPIWPANYVNMPSLQLIDWMLITPPFT